MKLKSIFARLRGGKLSYTQISNRVRAAVSPTRLSLSLLLLAFFSVPTLSNAQSCPLNGSSKIQHVVYIQFDNVHFTRDNPNVPSDLEQMPHLLDFIKKHGTLLTNHHTPLISHTADDILTSLTGVYPEHHGQAVANSFGYFTPPGSQNFDGFSSSFAYWTDIVNATSDPTYNMITANGQNAPAPWVAFTRAGCDVGAVSIANIEFENVSSDINNVFGPNSPEAQEAKTNRAQAIADFEGIAVHCAVGSPVCSAANGGDADVLPQEPNGYSGFNALYGNKFVAPVISPNGPVKDLDGNVITDGNGHVGFPGFGGISASQSLAYVADMQAQNIPVTFAYISDAHDDHVNGVAFGPGQAGYVAQLASYDSAFNKFFTLLGSQGINQKNTLFVVTADEGDHFAGGAPSPAGCDGINVPCTYSQIGEIDSNITHLLQTLDPNIANTPFDIHFDMAPTFYLTGEPGTGNPILREFEQDAAQLTVVNPITGNTDKLTRYLADGPELSILHMITGDPQRTPSFVMFGDPDYFFQTNGPDAQENPGFAWNHGGVDSAINTTFLGLVGPGVAKHGIDGTTWSDHTDIRPTMLSVLGLQDDYSHDGRTLIEDLTTDGLTTGLRRGKLQFQLLAQVYKLINAPVGYLGLSTLGASTRALAGDDATYTQIEGQLSALVTQRDALAAQIIQVLENAEFNSQPVNSKVASLLISQAEALLYQIPTAKVNKP